ncbi:MAG: TAXI family TRAP transporter solute-binding subunit [Stappiaceae bacterium]
MQSFSSMRETAFRYVVSMIFLLFCGSAAFAAERPLSEAQSKQYANGGTVRIITKGLGCTCTNVASDMAKVLNDMGQLRVLPVLGHGSIQGIADVMHLKGIDLSILQSDVLAYVKRNKLHQNIDNRVRFVTRLYSSELHLVAGAGIERIEDLQGKVVNFDVKGRGAAITAQNVFDALGIEPQKVNLERDVAIEKVRSGEIAASFVVTGKPAASMQKIEPGNGLHLLSIPINEAIANSYVPATLSHEEYPNLIPEGQVIETIAVAEVLAVYNWKDDTDRYRKLEGFVDALFSNIDQFHEPIRHPKWKDVNITASVPGWTRFKPAQQWLDNHAKQVDVAQQTSSSSDLELRERFQKFLVESGYKPQSQPNARQVELMFQDFLRWRQQTTAASTTQ